jgi:16S rRNA (guanine527-N7)-methyltransferase
VDPLEQMLVEGMAAMNLNASAKQQGQLLDFLRLLKKWNRVYNLTSIDNHVDWVRLHLLDSLTVLPHLKGVRALDVGTGAGLPGLPLAIFSPDREFTLLDSNAKKTRFVMQAAIELGLSNVNVVHVRIGQFQTPEGFDSILARAFAKLPQIVAETLRLLNPEGVILAQKGKLPQDEINSLENLIVEVIPLAVPGFEAERHLIAIKVRN